MIRRTARSFLRDAVISWGSLLLGITAASLLYAMLVVRQASEVIQLGLPFTVLLLSLASTYPRLELHRRMWHYLRSQTVDLFLIRSGTWAGKLLLLMLAVAVLLSVVNAAKGEFSTVQMVLFVLLLLLAVLLAGQWWDFLGLVWNRFAEQRKWNRRWKSWLLVVPMASICWLLVPMQLPSEQTLGWVAFSASACLLLALPLFASLVALVVLLISWVSAIMEELPKVFSHIRELRRALPKEKGWNRTRAGLVLAGNLGLAFGMILVLVVSVPILYFAWKKATFQS